MATSIDGSLPPLRPQSASDPAPAPAAASAPVASPVNIDEILQLAKSFASGREPLGAKNTSLRGTSNQSGAPELPATGMSMDDAAVADKASVQ